MATPHEHDVVLHNDGLVPWCDRCGLDINRRIPVRTSAFPTNLEYDGAQVPSYRRRPDRVKAFKLSEENAAAVALWCGGQKVEEIDPVTDLPNVGLNVPTISGNRRASEGDYIYRDKAGFIRVARAPEFEAKYSPES